MLSTALWLLSPVLLFGLLRRMNALRVSAQGSTKNRKGTAITAPTAGICLGKYTETRNKKSGSPDEAERPNLSDPAMKDVNCNQSVGAGFAGAHGSAVLCDMLGCREHATGEVQIGDEYIPLCELHRHKEMDRLTPKWRPLPPHPPNREYPDQIS